MGLAGDSSGGIDHDQIGVSVSVQIDHESLDGAVSGKRDPPEWVYGLAVVQIDIGIFVLAVAVAVGHEEVDVAVPVQVQPVDELDPSCSGDVGVGAAVFKSTL